MRTLTRLALISALLAPPGANAALYVSQVGTTGSTTALSNASTAAYVQKFDNSGVLQSTLALPVSDNGLNKAFTLGGTATSEGMLTRSADGAYLTIGGYGVAPGTASVSGTTSAAVNRVVARIDLASNTADTTTALSDAFSSATFRGVVSSDGQQFWLAGSSNGVRTATLGSTTSSVVTTTATNLRVPNIFNNQLYVSSMSGAYRGVSTVGTGLPTGSGEAMSLLTGFSPATDSPQSAYDYWFKDASTLFVADDRTVANGGGVQKWTFDSGSSTWSLQYTLNVGAGARGLAGTIDGSNNAVLYATTADNPSRLAAIVDTGASSVFATLATAGANTQFRGVEFVADGGTPAINANFDGVGGVNGNDFLIWQRGLGTGTTLAQGDSNASNSVDATDLLNWRNQFGTPAVAAVGAVPEPGSIALVGAALAGALRVTRRRAGR